MTGREQEIDGLSAVVTSYEARIERRGPFVPRGAAELDPLEERLGETMARIGELRATTDAEYDAEQARVQAIWDAEDAAYEAARR